MYTNSGNYFYFYPTKRVLCSCIRGWDALIILCMDSANERRRYIVTWSLIGWTHAQNDHWYVDVVAGSVNHFTKSFWAHQLKSCENSLCSNFSYNNSLRSQVVWELKIEITWKNLIDVILYFMIPLGHNFAHCHDMCKILTWSDHELAYKNDMFLTRFALRVHKLLRNQLIFYLWQDLSQWEKMLHL